MPADEKLFAELTQLYGPSGYEKDVCRFIKDYIGDEADDVKVDALGNLIVFREGTGAKKKRFMSSAHMDEIGLQVTAINEDGTISIKSLGYPFYYTTYQRRVMFKSGLVGIVEAKCEMGEANHEFTKFYVDLGLTSKEETAKLVDVGDTAIYLGEYQPLAGRYVTAKAIDDRIGCTQMIKLMEKDLPMDVTFVFTVQEEVGLRGAKAAAFNLAPDIALILEGTTSADMPGVDDAKKVTLVGGGCVIGCVDTGTIYDRKLFECLRDLADETGIPWQIKNYIAGGTDAAVIQRSRAGVRVANISTPVRMLHAASTVADKTDMENGLKLAELFINAIAAGKVK